MSSRDVTIVGFTLIALSTAVLILAGRSERIASVSEVIDALLVRRTTRFLVILGWWWVGWHFLARTV